MWATSALWEYGVEFNEFPSINDMIFTPQGGVSVGEPTYRLGRFFDAGSPTFANRLGALIFSPFSVIDDWASGRHQPRGPPTPTASCSRTGTASSFGLDGLTSNLDGQRGATLESVAIDTALAEATSATGARATGGRRSRPGEWTRARACGCLHGGHAGLQGFDLHSSTLVAGRYFRSYDESWCPTASPGPDNLRGRGAMPSASAPPSTTPRGDPPAQGRTRLVKYGGSRFPDRMLEIRLGCRGRAGLRFSMQTYYAFAQVDSLVYAAYGDPLTSAAYEINTPLRQQGYYYGQGLSSLSTLVARLGDFELSLMTSLAAYWSINFRDRYQENLHNELEVSDTRASGAVAAGYRPGGGPVRLSARIEHYERTGELQGKSAISLETRAGLGVAFVF